MKMTISDDLRMIIENSYVLRTNEKTDDERDIQELVRDIFYEVKDLLNISMIDIICIDSFNKSSIVVTDCKNLKKYLIFDIHQLMILETFLASYYKVGNVSVAGIVPLLFAEGMIIKRNYKEAFFFAQTLKLQRECEKKYPLEIFQQLPDWNSLSIEARENLKEKMDAISYLCYIGHSSYFAPFILLHELSHFLYDEYAIAEIEEISRLVEEYYNTLVLLDESGRIINSNLELKKSLTKLGELIEKNPADYLTSKFMDSIEEEDIKEMYITGCLAYNAKLAENSNYTISREKKKYIRECTCDVYALLKIVEMYMEKDSASENVLPIILESALFCIAFMGLLNSLDFAIEMGIETTIEDIEMPCAEMIDRFNIVGNILGKKMPNCKYILEEIQNNFWEEYRSYYEHFIDNCISINEYKNENGIQADYEQEQNDINDHELFEKIMKIIDNI